MAKKVLFINQEITPYVPETDLSTMGRKLPQAIQEKGYEIRTFMPKWGMINERRGQLHEVIRLSGMNIIINETDHPLVIKVASIQSTRIQVYFIDNDDYFPKRKAGAEDSCKDNDDNGERAIFFARGVLETVKKLRWAPDIIHCQGWMGSIIPFYLKTAYKEEPSFANAKVVTSLFAEQPQSGLGGNMKKMMAFREAKVSLLKGYDSAFGPAELAKLAVDYSDGIIEAAAGVSPELTARAQERGIPVLPCPGDDYAQAYDTFYNSLI